MRLSEKQKRKKQRMIDKLQHQRDEADTVTAKGRARAAYDRGDQVFQYDSVLSKQRGYVNGLGGGVHMTDYDLSEEVNEIIAEGWELTNTTVTFRPEKERSRDRFLASGQQTSISGARMATYVFTRNSAMKTSKPSEENTVAEEVEEIPTNIHSWADFKQAYKAAKKVTDSTRPKTPRRA